MCVILCGGRATFLLRVNCCESDDHNCSLVIFCDFPLLEQLLVEQGLETNVGRRNLIEFLTRIKNVNLCNDQFGAGWPGDRLSNFA